MTNEFFSSSPQPDSLAVKIQNLDSGATVQDFQTVFTLNGQYDGNGATAWRTLSVPVTGLQTILLTASALNAGDAAYISLVEIDQVVEKGLNINNFDLFEYPILASNPNISEPLDFLSVSTHAAYSGKTRVRGTVSISGTSGDSLSSAVLEIYEIVGTNPVLRASTPLAASASGALIGVPFPANGPLTITVPQLLFEIPSSDFGAINQTTNGELLLRLKVVSQAGRTSSRDLGRRVKKLVWYGGQNRYGVGRDLDVCTGAPKRPNYPCGGDSWTLPSIVPSSQALPDIVVNDFSNMNGGIFPDHTSHKVAIDVDAKFGTTHQNSWFAVNANAAQRLINLLNGPLGNRIAFIYATYRTTQTDPFWNAIKDVQLNDGSYIVPRDLAKNPTVETRLRGRIRNYPGHTDHFHINWRP